MTSPLRICLFDPVGSPREPFREPFDQLPQTHVVNEFATWEQLQECLASTNIDAVALNLDGTKDNGSYIIQRTAEIAPNCSILAVSRSDDPNLIIKAMRAGCHQFVRWPIDRQDLIAALDRLRSVRTPAPSVSKRICVIGSAGGAGATTLACNLALELSRLTSQACALVDMNLEFGEVACAFDCTPRYSIADICDSDVEVDRTMLESVLEELPCNVTILSRPDDIAQAGAVTPEGVHQVFRLLGTMFPFVLADLPRGGNNLSAAALHGVDHALIITQLTVSSLRNATRIYECMSHMGVSADRFDIVLNRCNANFERIKPEDVEAHFRRPVLAIIPNDYRRVANARDLGHPIFTDSPNSTARLAIHELARKLAAGYVTDPGAGAKTSGLLAKFWKRSPAEQQPAG
ncbi:MAG: hypothetical protein KKB50_12700 [Planctomycetes bacterium]|nr:hypothetical protein [Planctomycetota bacterium]